MVLNKGTFAGALILASLIGTTADSAQAAYIVTFSETGNDVTVSGSGAIDLAGLTFITSGFTTPEVAPTFATEATGGAGSVDEYSGAAGPFSFGSGVFTSEDQPPGAAAFSCSDGYASARSCPTNHLRRQSLPPWMQRLPVIRARALRDPRLRGLSQS